jgi:hypothetical protein
MPVSVGAVVEVAPTNDDGVVSIVSHARPSVRP